MSTTTTTEAPRWRIARLLKSLEPAPTTVRYTTSATIFAQGDLCAGVMYIQTGRVKLLATSAHGRQAAVGILGAGAFFGEGALAGQRRRRMTAEAITSCTIMMVTTAQMRRGLREEPALSERFRWHLLARNSRIEAAVVDQVFNGWELRLARALLLLARVDEHEATRYPLPIISRGLLAEMIGARRSTVELLMNKFRKLGFLECRSERYGGVQVHRSMLSVVLRD
jgi:CRP/FNR family transcriptional regulator, cyclic AMP receptor protein